MKKILLLIMVISATSTVMIAQKFGHIDSAALMAVVPGAAEANAELDQKTQEHQAVISDLENQYATKVQDFQSNPPPTDIGQQLAIQDIQNLEMSIQEYAKTAQSDLAETEQRLLEPLINKAKQAIEDVGTDNGFTYIFDSSVGVLLFEGGEDVMPLVKTKLGIVDSE